MSTPKDVWFLVESEQGQLQDISLQLVSGSRQLADKFGEDVCAIVFGSSNEELAKELASYGADRVAFLDSPLLSSYSSELYVDALSKFLEDRNAGVFLCGATLIGRDLAPRLAAKLKTGLVSDCVALEIDAEGRLVPTKHTYGGKAYTKLAYSTAKPWLVTVRPDVIEAKKLATAKRPEKISITPQFNSHEPRIKTIGFVKGDPSTIGIEEAEMIVAGGRGVGSADKFRLLEELAKVLGASIAGSLQAVDAGWLPLERQVGQTGKTVSPRLYIACGISGASYHTLGMKDSETVIAINTDRYAPIFKLADVGIVGNLLEVVPAITEKLRGIIKTDTPANPDEVKDVFSSQ